MIEISLTAALALYSGIIVAGALAIWLYTEAATQRSYRVLEKQHLWRCTFCAYTYLDEAAEAFSQCPRCQSINTLEDPQARFVPARAQPSIPDELPREVPARRSPSRQKRPGARRRGPRRRR